MAAFDYDSLVSHVGHKITCVTYGDPPENVSIECEDCCCVLLDFNKDPEPDEEGVMDPKALGDLLSQDDEPDDSILTKAVNE